MNLSEYLSLKLFYNRLEKLKEDIRDVYKKKINNEAGELLIEKKKKKIAVPRTEFSDVSDIDNGEIIKTEGNFFIMKDKDRYLIFRRKETVKVDDEVLNDIKKLALKCDTYEESITEEDRQNNPKDIEEDRMLIEMMEDRGIIVRKTLSKTDFQKIFYNEVKTTPELNHGFIDFFNENFPNHVNPDKPTKATQKNIKMIDIEDMFELDRKFGRGMVSSYQDEGYTLTKKEEYRINASVKNEPSILMSGIGEDFSIKIKKYEANFKSLEREFEESSTADVIDLCKRAVYLFKKIEREMSGLTYEDFLDEDKDKGYLNKIVKSIFEYEGGDKNFTVPSFDLRAFKKEALGLGIDGEKGYSITDYGIVDTMEEARLTAKTIYTMEQSSIEKKLNSPSIIKF